MTALSLAFGGGVFAQTPDEALFLRRDDLRIVPFASVDVGRSVFVTAGLKQALTGPLDRQGYVALESLGYGLTRERGDAALGSIIRHTLQTSSLVGYQFSTHGVFVGAFVGPEITWEQVTFDGVIARWSEPRLGARVQGEIWAHPTSDTLVTGTVVAGTTQGSVWARGSAGYRLTGHLFLGPEASLYMTDTYREVRVGAHVTGASLGRIDLRLSAGVQSQDDDRKASPYLGLSGHFKM